MYTIFVLIALTSYIWGGNAVTTPPPGMNDPYLGGPGKPRPVRRMRPSPSQQQQRRKQLEEEQQDQQQQNSKGCGYVSLCIGIIGITGVYRYKVQ